MSTPSFMRNIEFIVETLREAKRRGRGCSLLIGAGCSVQAGIPTASGFVDIIGERYPQRYGLAPNKTYPDCMAELLDGERRDLIGEFVDKSDLNWAHVCIALLMKSGYVDRVLTTNFDPLVVKACALMGEFPAVYDLAASEHFKAADLIDKSVFYLHGQRTGFVLLNTKEEVQSHSNRLGPVFEDAGRGRVWIVAGYSGDNDPVFNHLAGVRRFDNGLFWIGYKDNSPAPHVQDKLLVARKNAFFTNGYDADSFFIVLCQQLGIFPPELVSKPFTHMLELLRTLTPYRILDGTAEDVTALPRRFLEKAIADYEPGVHAVLSSDINPTKLAVWVQSKVMANDFDSAIAVHNTNLMSRELDPVLNNAFSLAYALKGSRLLRLLRFGGSGGERKSRLIQAKDLLERANSLEERVSVYDDLGAVYGELARVTKNMDQSIEYWTSSMEMRRKALVLEHSVRRVVLLGIALVEMSKVTKGEESATLRQAGKEQFLLAEGIEEGSGSYDLACVSALDGNAPEARQWLEHSKLMGKLPSIQHILEDADLAGVNKEDWFLDFVGVKITKGTKKSRRKSGAEQ